MLKYPEYLYLYLCHRKDEPSGTPELYLLFKRSREWIDALQEQVSFVVISKPKKLILAKVSLLRKIKGACEILKQQVLKRFFFLI